MSRQVTQSTIREINRYYDSAAAVDALSNWYTVEKERAFIDFILTGLPLPSTGDFVEIGGGTGLQGLLVRDRLGARYRHSDYAPALVDKARKLGLKSDIVDGLAMPFADGVIAGLLLVGPSTIVGDEAIRRRQFEECARVLMSGGVAILISSRLATMRHRHCLDRRDEGMLESLGLQVRSVRYWGVVPGRFWSSGRAKSFGWIEARAAAVRLGVRKIVTVVKHPVAS